MKGNVCHFYFYKPSWVVCVTWPCSKWFKHPLLLLLLSYYGWSFAVSSKSNPYGLLYSASSAISSRSFICSSIVGYQRDSWISLRRQNGLTMIGNRASSTIYQVNEHITLKSIKPWYRSTQSSELYSTYLRILYHCVLLTDRGNIYCMLEQHPRLYRQTHWYRS